MYILVFILSEKESRESGGEKVFSSIESLLRWPQKPGLCQAKFKSLGRIWIFNLGDRDLRTWSLKVLGCGSAGIWIEARNIVFSCRTGLPKWWPHQTPAWRYKILVIVSVEVIAV